MMKFLQKVMFQFHLNIQRRLANVKMKFVETSQGKISYLEGGKGPTLILIHGFGADKDTWAKLAGYLTKRYRVIAVDIPGFGESYAPGDNVTILEQAKRLEHFIDKLGVDTFGLIGSSYGGYLSALLASRNHQRVKELCLISPLGIENTDYTDLFQRVLKGEKPMLLPSNLQELKTLLLRCFNNVPYVPTFALKQLLTRSKPRSELHQRIFYQTHKIEKKHIYFDSPVEKLLEEISCKTTVIWGEEDQILSVGAVKTLKSLSNSLLSIEVLKGQGHLPQMESADQIYEIISR